MGFDIECIIDIHVYPEEYFCPVCRTLVYPNEALQSQCTHLWCKPCLAHVAKNTRACPYDGFLVTEADSKPLVELDKALAESIGTVKVRCLYHRSGCTWEGPLCECTSHCSGCAFGNSPVICSQCGIQIVHRQLHDHAQSCPGVYQVQQAADTAQVVPSSGLNASTGDANQNQATSQAGAPTSWAQNAQSAPAPLLPGLDSKQQAYANSQTPAAVPFVALTTEQWYHLQYRQYAEYDLHRQAYPYHYPYQQLAVQQYGQPPHQAYGQPPHQAYGQPQIQVYAGVQAQTSSEPQTPVQPQSQPQPPAQPQPVQFQTNTQAQVQTHGPALFHSHVQPLAQNPDQAQVNPQQVPQPAMQSHAQNPSQAYSVHGLPAPQTQHYNQPHPQPQLHPLQPQANHQPHLQMPHPQTSMVHLQAHMLTQSQLQPQPQSQIQPQPHLHPYLLPTQLNQPTAPNAQTPSVHSSGHAASGHQSYLLTQLPQQQPASAHLDNGSLPSGQMQSQILPQPSLIDTSPSQGRVPNHHLALFPSLCQAFMMPPAHQQQFHPQTPHLSDPNQQHPLIHSSQQSVFQQYVQQQPFSGVVESQLNHHSHLVQQQSQLCPQGPPHMMQQSSNANVQLQQNVAVASGVQSQQPQNYVVRPVMPNQGVPTQQQPAADSSSGFVAEAQVRHAQLGPYQDFTNQYFANKTNNQLQTASDQQLLQSGMASTSGALPSQGDNVSGKRNFGYETGLPSQNVAVKIANAPSVDSVDLKPLKSDIGLSYEQETTRESTGKSGSSESLAGKELHGGIDGSGQPVGKLRLKVERIVYSSGHSSDINSTEVAKHRDTVGDIRTENLEFHRNRKTIFIKSGDENLQSNTGPDKQPKSAGPPIFPSVTPLGPPPPAQVPGYSSTSVRPQGSGLLPQSGQLLNPNEQFRSVLLGKPHDIPSGGIPSEGIPALGSMASFGRGPAPFGAPQGPPLTSLPPGPADPQSGIMRRHAQHGPEGQFGMQGSVNSLKSEVEPNALWKNGGPSRDNSVLESQDERFKALPGKHSNLFIKEITGPRDQGSRPVDRTPLGLTHGAGGGHTSRVLLPLQPPGGPGKVKRADLSGQDIPPSHFCRGELLGYGTTPSHYGTFPGHGWMGEMSQPANLPHKLLYGEPFADNKPGLPQLGEPGGSSFSHQGFPNNGPYAGDMGDFNNSRKRKHLSVGWCCMCRVDCVTVEGLDIHSQTREHKKMSMDIVLGINRQNDKKSRASYARAGCEGRSKKRNSGPDGRGKKP